MSGSSVFVKPGQDAELDDAFARINSYLFATENTIVRKMMIKNLEELAKEVSKRDSSLTFKMKQYILTLKGMMK